MLDARHLSGRSRPAVPLSSLASTLPCIDGRKPVGSPFCHTVPLPFVKPRPWRTAGRPAQPSARHRDWRVTTSAIPPSSKSLQATLCPASNFSFVFSLGR